MDSEYISAQYHAQVFRNWIVSEKFIKSFGLLNNIEHHQDYVQFKYANTFFKIDFESGKDFIYVGIESMFNNEVWDYFGKKKIDLKRFERGSVKAEETYFLFMKEEITNILVEYHNRQENYGEY